MTYTVYTHLTEFHLRAIRTLLTRSAQEESGVAVLPYTMCGQ